MKAFWVDDDKTIIQLDFKPPPQSWDDYHRGIADAIQLANSVTHPVFFINNAGNADMPSGNRLGHIEQTIKRLPNNIVGGATVITNGIARRIVKIALLIYGSKLGNFKVVKSIEVAMAHIDSERADV